MIYYEWAWQFEVEARVDWNGEEKLHEGVLYLMIVNTASEAEIAETVGVGEKAS